MLLRMEEWRVAAWLPGELLESGWRKNNANKDRIPFFG
jgi:hypothetical protein